MVVRIMWLVPAGVAGGTTRCWRRWRGYWHGSQPYSSTTHASLPSTSQWPPWQCCSPWSAHPLTPVSWLDNSVSGPSPKPAGADSEVDRRRSPRRPSRGEHTRDQRLNPWTHPGPDQPQPACAAYIEESEVWARRLLSYCDNSWLSPCGSCGLTMALNGREKAVRVIQLERDALTRCSTSTYRAFLIAWTAIITRNRIEPLAE